ncbi:MAG: mechanosensitive ion channel family protein [Campylobacterota bacterium]|nr:mechanosensitive ion channel family protein [Campylobacterota bacterium]
MFLDKFKGIIPADILTVLNYQFLGNSVATWITALVVFIVIVSLSKTFTQVILSPFRRLFAKSLTKLDDKIIDVIEKPLNLSIVIGGYYLAAMLLASNEELEILITHIMRSAIIVLIALTVTRILVVYGDTFAQKASRKDPGLGEAITKLVVRILKFVIIVSAGIGIANTWGINAYAVLASFSIIGVGISLSSQDTVKHFWGSMVIFGDQPFKIGDWITVGNVDGTVEEIGIRSTKVRTFEKAMFTVPNGTMANANILNWSRRPKRRIKMTMGLSYSTTQEQMKSILNETRAYLKSDEAIDQDQILVYFSEFNDSSLDIMVYCFTKDPNWAAWLEAREVVYLELMGIVERNGSSFAFPSQSLYVESLPDENREIPNVL